MENSKKSIIIFLIIAGVIAASYYFFFVDRKTDKKQGAETKQEISESERVAQELADKYQAATDWDEKLSYTLQAQERLLTGRPALFRGYVDDIFKRDGKNFIRFSSSFLSSADYVLELECAQQVVDKIFAQKPDDETSLKFFDEYVVVANIQEVTKPVFALKGSTLSEDEVEIDVKSSELFIAKGTCVDIAYLSEGLPSWITKD